MSMRTGAAWWNWLRRVCGCVGHRWELHSRGCGYGTMFYRECRRCGEVELCMRRA